MTVEEAIRTQRDTSIFMLQYSELLSADRIMFPCGKDDVCQMSIAMSQAAVYVWSKPIQRIVEKSRDGYPLHEAIDALHYFHQPCMLWIFDEAVQWVREPNGDRKAPVDGILVIPYTRGPTPSANALVDRVRRFIGGTSEERAQLNEEVRTKATGVQVIACTSFKTGIPVQLPTCTVPAGSRLLSPIMVTTFDFGRSASYHRVHEALVDDPTLKDEQTVLKQFTLAASALLKQRILVAQVQLATRAERKRLACENLSNAVMTITLRATEHQSTMSAGSIIEWSHRWIVRGHWRKQWYPATEEHRILWIPSYIKGPSDRPLIVRPEVYAVNR